ncbi:hypothetical protein K443DRAFT_90844, partial [Laccaria amethystina LaAM-08-1]
LHSLHYKTSETEMNISLVAGATTHSVYTNPHGKITTLTESKESDSFLGVIAESNHTASMNFISGKYYAALYPIQSLSQQTTYSYRYSLDAFTAANILEKGYSIISDSIGHPTECCPVAHHQFATLAGIGLLQWCNNNDGNLLTTSYSWRLGDDCLDNYCSTTAISPRLMRRTSLSLESSDTSDSDVIDNY